MRFASVGAAALLATTLILGVAGDAADIDVGFVQDGHTTYCHGITQAQTGPLVFDELHTSSSGHCPIQVDISLAHDVLPSIATPLQVTWTAALVPPTNLKSSLFPRVVDPTTQNPHNVIASLLRACKADSNCAEGDTTVVIPAMVGSPQDSVGAFDSVTNKKPLSSYLFQFPSEGEYVIVGKVVLPGDAALNISATEFVSFQRVQVGGDAPGTVKPHVPAVAVEPATTPPHPVENEKVTVSSEDPKGATITGSSAGGNNAKMVILLVVAGVGLVGAIAAFTVARGRQAQSARNMPIPQDIYRLDDNARRPRPQPMHKATTRPPRQPPVPAAPPPQAEHYPTHRGGGIPVIGLAGTTASYCEEPPCGFFGSDGNVLESSMHSDRTSFGGLHDSAVRLPVDSSRRQRPLLPSPSSSMASSVTLDHVSLGGSTGCGEDDVNPFESTIATDINIIYNSRRTTGATDLPRTTDLSEYDAHNANALGDSTYSWVYSDSDLLASIHEPAAPRRTDTK